MLALVVFPLTGAYLRSIFPDAFAEDEVVRYQYRANHVYILWSGLLNLMVGMHLRFRDRPLWRRLQVAGSTILLLAPFALIAAFFLEPRSASPERTITSLTMIALLIGVILHMPGGAWRKRASD